METVGLFEALMSIQQARQQPKIYWFALEDGTER
jgi:hypothetical protein